MDDEPPPPPFEEDELPPEWEELPPDEPEEDGLCAGAGGAGELSPPVRTGPTTGIPPIIEGKAPERRPPKSWRPCIDSSNWSLG